MVAERIYLLEGWEVVALPTIRFPDSAHRHTCSHGLCVAPSEHICNMRVYFVSGRWEGSCVKLEECHQIFKHQCDRPQQGGGLKGIDAK